jgi:predicted nucleotidyltransferase
VDPLNQLSISESTRAHLDTFVRSLSGTLGENLVAVVVHGSAARGGWRDGESDVDVVIVLKVDAKALLDGVGNALQVARYAARVEAIILREDEIPRSADVFPLLYGDIVRCHVVIHGNDPFAGLVITPHHVRLRTEQELRDARIRLRRIVADSLGATGPIRAAVSRKVRQLRSPLRALLELCGVPTEDTLQSVIHAAAARYDLDGALLLDVAANPAVQLASLVRLLDAATDEADRLDPERRA